MLNKIEAKMMATLAIADVLGREYVRDNIEDCCEAQTADNDKEFFYFLGFENDGDLWSIFASLVVNRETEAVTF